MSNTSVYYITSVRGNSVSGDGVHIRNVVKESDFLHKNLRWFWLYGFLFFNRKNKKIIRESVDVLLLCLILPRAALRLVLERSVIEVNGSIVDETQWFFTKLAQKKLFESARNVIVVSVGLKKRFEDIHGSECMGKVIVVNNGGEDKAINDSFMRPKVVRLGFVGAKTHWQDIDNVLDDLKQRAVNDDTRIEVVIAGPGFEQYSNETSNRVSFTFLGSVDSEKAELIYRDTDVLICPDNRVYKGYLLSSPIKAYECLNMGVLVSFFHDWKYIDEFGFAKDRVIDWSRVIDFDYIKQIRTEVCNKNMITRTWKDVVSELNRVIDFD